ncbi:MAG: hypothetical protein F6J93_14680 [Oscillatoria sp. SIO1A7]|nr:hypothetical protein [Oscillatoria sp. SIO1A7]
MGFLWEKFTLVFTTGLNKGQSSRGAEGPRSRGGREASFFLRSLRFLRFLRSLRRERSRAIVRGRSRSLGMRCRKRSRRANAAICTREETGRSTSLLFVDSTTTCFVLHPLSDGGITAPREVKSQKSCIQNSLLSLEAKAF